MTKLFVKKLTNLDFSFLDADRGLVGESWLLDIELSGKLNEQGMVLDFGIVKRLVKDYINKYIDHCLLVPSKYEGCDVLDLDKYVEVAFYLRDGQSITQRSISDAVAKIPAEKITIESVKSFLLSELQALLPANVTGLNIHLYNEPGLEQSYQYSHGLRKHDGNCQRIAHGHRSGIEIFVDQERSQKWEKYWLDTWQDIYIGTRRHLQNNADTSSRYLHFKYQAPQGHFSLKLPTNKCYLIDAESTVENIAEHLASEIASKEPGKKILVRAFEGIDKGAIAEDCQ
ncbi:MAG: 6-pyruvoyl-tetrahydropterin synthase [Enterobacterales bacterium]